MLIAMVGERVQEMELAGWLMTTHLPLPVGPVVRHFPECGGSAGRDLRARFVLPGRMPQGQAVQEAGRDAGATS